MILSPRHLCRRLHYWFGVAIALPFLVMSVTGAILSFAHELDPLLSPGLFQPSGPERVISAQQVLDTARADGGAPVMSLQLPDATAPVWVVAQGSGRGANMGVQQETFIDPQSGAILGQRDLATAPLRIAHRLHNAFLLDGGRQLVGIIALLMAGMIVTGVIVWWPPAHGVSDSLLPCRGTKGTRWLLDWHTAAALWPFLLILSITVTGITMAFPQSSRAVLGQPGDGGMGRMGNHPVLAPTTPYPVGADQALDAARQALPGYDAVSLTPAGLDHPHWRITLRPSQGLWLGRRQIMVDARSGEVQAETARDAVALFLAEQHGLHGGASFGLPGRVLICVAGLCQAFLCVSGLLVWARRQRRRASSLPVALPQEN